MDPLHRRLLQIGFDAGDDLGLVLAGGYALGAHRLVERPSRDIDFATATPMPLPQVVDRLVAAYRAAGFSVQIIEVRARMARLLVSAGAEVSEVDLLKEAIGQPALMEIGPVLAFDDAVGLKVRALHDRAAHRDFIDVRAANDRVSVRELETLGARHTANFSVEELADRLGAVEELDDRAFLAYRLDDAEISGLKRWAAAWESDIRARLAAGEAGPAGVTATEWDAYLDEPPDVFFD